MVNININIKTILIAGTALVAAQAQAGVVTRQIYWSTGDAAGQLAATCTYHLPDEQPLAVPRTIVVNKNTPNNTALFSWGYGEFVSDQTVNCVSSGITNSDNNSAASTNLVVSSTSASTDANGFTTSISGIRLKVWARLNTSCNTSGNPYASIISVAGTSTSCPAAGTEALFYSSSINRTYYYLSSRPLESRYSFPDGGASFSFRAQLVKYGTLPASYASPLTVPLPNTLSFYTDISTTNAVSTNPGLSSGSGITIVPAACQLQTQNYTILMKNWETKQTTPSRGPEVPVDLALECNGEVDHVRFRFEDTGSSLSANKNVSLYDSAGGNKIDGLEIEMLYNGTKVNVDNSTLTDTGSHGAFVSYTPDFDSFSSAPFKARYVQNSDITLAGAHYTGPVTGKVNMYVTYD